MDDFNIKDDDDILELVKELEEDGLSCAYLPRLIAERNENFVNGNQHQDINMYTRTMGDAWFPGVTGMPRVTNNHLRNIVNTFKTRVTKDRPDVTAWASVATEEAYAAAKIAAKLIEYNEEEIQFDHMLDEVVRLGTMHGVAGFKIFYNPTTLNVEWQPLSIFQFLIDPTKELFTQADWCLFEIHINKFEARSMLKQAGIDEQPPSTTYTVNGSEEREGVRILELWHKPTARLPEGLFCKVMGRHILDRRPYPYTFPCLEDPTKPMPTHALPLALFKVDYHRGTPYADTFLSDAVGAQRKVNESESVIQRISRETAYVKTRVSNQALAQQINNRSQTIVGQPGDVEVLPPPQINSLLFTEREHAVKTLYDIVGLNEQLLGQESFHSGTSAKQIAYLNELDGMKHKGTSQSIEMMIELANKLHLQLVQHYYLDERVMNIASAEGVDVVSFRGADIQGVRVKLEPRGGLERMSASKAAQAEADAQAGYLPPAQAQELRHTGQDETMVARLTRKVVGAEIQAIFQGAPVSPPDPSLDAAVALAEIQRIKSILLERGARPDQLAMLDQYAAAFQAALAPPPPPPEGIVQP